MGPVMGYCDGDGTDTVGLYDLDGSYRYLKPSFDSGWDDCRFKYGQSYNNWDPTTDYWGDMS